MPYINKNGKIITVGSQAGTFNYTIKNDKLKQEFTDPTLNREKLFGLAKKFADEVEKGTYDETGFKKSAYGMS